MKTTAKILLLIVAVAAIGVWGVRPPISVADPNGEGHEDEEAAHVHVPAPLPYADAHMPVGAWTDAGLITRGKEIYTVKCAICHGDAGDGKGPAGAALPLKPPDLRDRHAIAEMRDNYWFWRVSEGGSVEPFKSKGSAMPPWKGDLPVQAQAASVVGRNAEALRKAVENHDIEKVWDRRGVRRFRVYLNDIVELDAQFRAARR